jgi:predicted esterase
MPAMRAKGLLLAAAIPLFSLEAQDPAPHRPAPDSSFYTVVPSAAGVPGLLVMINSPEAAEPPFGWEEVLAEKNIVYLCLVQRPLATDAERLEQALLGIRGATEKFRVDLRRVYVGGFHDGARLAALLAFQHPGLIRGAVGFGGTYFDRQAGSSARTEVRFVVVTGETDARRDEILKTFRDGFARAKFQALLMDEPPQTLSSPGVLRRILDFLEDRKIP